MNTISAPIPDVERSSAFHLQTLIEDPPRSIPIAFILFCEKRFQGVENGGWMGSLFRTEWVCGGLQRWDGSSLRNTAFVVNPLYDLWALWS